MSGASTGKLLGDYFFLEFTDGLCISPADDDYSDIIAGADQYSQLLVKGLPEFNAIVATVMQDKNLPFVSYVVTDSIDGTVIEDDTQAQFSSEAKLALELVRLEETLLKGAESSIMLPIVTYKNNAYGEPTTFISGVTDENRHLLPITKKKIEIEQQSRLNQICFDMYFRESKHTSINIWQSASLSDPYYYQFTIRFSVTDQVRRSHIQQIVDEFKIVLVRLLGEDTEL